MRKVHYKVVLDVLTTEDDDANGKEMLERSGFWPDDVDLYSLDVQCVDIESVEVTDSR